MDTATLADVAHQLRRGHRLIAQTVYECSSCQERLLGERRCSSCNLWCRKVGIGGECSGYGYSAYWFTRAVGPGGAVICTDSDPANRDLAERFLSEAGRWDRVEYQVGIAQDVLQRTPGTFDIVYNDIDKQDYPAAWYLARERVRPGGLYICDNVLWSGRVAEDDDDSASTQAIRRHNELVYADPNFDACLIPTRDGVLVARRHTS